MLVTKSQFARIRGVSRTEVARMKESGKLTMVGDLIDSVASEAALGPPKRHKKPKPTQPVDYLEAKARSETARARLLTLEADTQEGELISLEVVKREIFEMARTVRDGLQSSRSRLAPLLAAESDPFKIDKILADEFSRLSREFSACKYIAH